MRLYYFTNSFPYGTGEQWKLQELEAIKSYFTEIIVIPFTSRGTSSYTHRLSDNIKVLDPLFDFEPNNYSLKDILYSSIVFFPLVFTEVITKKLYLDRKKLGKAMLYLSGVQAIKQHSTFKDLIRSSTAETYWFFYWGRGMADVLPFVKSVKRNKLGIRLHGYDIFEARNNGYIPFRTAVYKKADIIFPVSEYGKAHLINNYSRFENKVKVARLGTKTIGLSSPSTNGTFHILTCSNLVPVKRVELLARALKTIKGFKIRWTHIGSGPMLNIIQEQTKEMPVNVDVELLGHIESSKVLPTLISMPVDLFVNVSESEGVPVSVMEALSAGIPVLATDAGGTREIVDDSVGKLVDVNLNEQTLANNIEQFICLPEKEKKLLREGAFRRYTEMCDMDKCTEYFIKTFLA